jgi:hypothetical protein
VGLIAKQLRIMHMTSLVIAMVALFAALFVAALLSSTRSSRRNSILEEPGADMPGGADAYVIPTRYAVLAEIVPGERQVEDVRPMDNPAERSAEAKPAHAGFDN